MRGLLKIFVHFTIPSFIWINLKNQFINLSSYKKKSMNQVKKAMGWVEITSKQWITHPILKRVEALKTFLSDRKSIFDLDILFRVDNCVYDKITAYHLRYLTK